MKHLWQLLGVDTDPSSLILSFKFNFRKPQKNNKILKYIGFFLIKFFVILIVDDILFPGLPPLPPSASAAYDRIHENEDTFWTDFKRLSKSKDFWILVIFSAIAQGIYAGWTDGYRSESHYLIPNSN